MATGGSGVPSQLKGGVWKTLSDNRLFLTLKFGFYQQQKEYRITDTTPVIDQLHRDAEEWLRSLPNSASASGTYTFYLFRLPTTDFTLVPILRQSDIEQNSLIEIILVPSEESRSAHSLYRCQLNVPTNCSRCTRFIAGFYRQGVRCRKCRRTFHKNCASLQINDCPVDSNDEQTTRRSNTSLKLINSHVNEMSSDVSQMTLVSTQDQSVPAGPNNIIEKGIFPACIRGSHVSRRFLFRLTTTILSISSDLSQTNFNQIYLTQPGETETFFPLIDIVKLVLTHKNDDRNDVFEIHLNNRTVLCVGKRTDPEEVQMDAAQFYSWISQQRETLINELPQSTPDSPKKLTSTKSTFALGPKDLYELYEFTGEKIGQGAFGRVVGARKKSNREEVAVKIIAKANCDEQEMARINDEINNLYKFNHVNILKLQAYYERDDAVYLVTERMETDLCKYIMNKQPFPCLDERSSKMIIYQLIVAVRYLHGQNCGHLDIKCDNVLLTLLKPRPTDNNFDSKMEYPLVKLADFGYSRFIGEHSFRKTRVGTRVYNAPEVNHGTTGYNRLADMWSVGMVMYASLSGQLPYDEVGSRHVEKYVQDRETLFASDRWRNISSDAKDLIANKLLVISSSSRITSNSAIFEGWFTDPDLCLDLREIERRTAYAVSKRDEKLPTSSHWLTGEREDVVWMAYRQAISSSEHSN